MTQPLGAVSDGDPESSLNLLLRAQSGGQAALNDLLARYLPRLERWASGRLPMGVRTMLETGDLVQDAVVNALRHLSTLEIRTEGALQAYLRQAVNNRIIDLFRRSARRPARTPLPDGLLARGTSPLDAAIGVEAMEQYERALAALREEDRQAIVLRVEFGLDYDEVARQLEKPTAAAARMAVKRAIARVAEAMARDRSRPAL
jgi:RNA polymerase sigma factor (sigma-70 family)